MQNVFLHVRLWWFCTQRINVSSGSACHTGFCVVPPNEMKKMKLYGNHYREAFLSTESQIMGTRWGQGERADNMLTHFHLISHSLTSWFPTQKDRSNEDSTTPVKPSQTDSEEEFYTSYRHINSKFSWKCHSCGWAPSLRTSALMSMHFLMSDPLNKILTSMFF